MAGLRRSFIWIAIVLSVVLLPASCTLMLATLGGGGGGNAVGFCEAPYVGVPAAQAGEIQVKGKVIDEEQLSNARIIYTLGLKRGFSLRDIKIAYMVAMQESSMRNLRYGDRDSLGMWQQRSTWGTVEDRTDPLKSTDLFYNEMAKVPDRGNKSLLDVALAVQRPSRAAYLSSGNNFLGEDRYKTADQLLSMFSRDSGGKQNVFVLGDSISLGAASVIRTAFKAAGFGSVTVNASVGRSITRPGTTGGQRTSGMEALRQEEVRKQIGGSQVVVIALGTNGEGSSADFRRNLGNLVDTVNSVQDGLQVYVVNIFSPAVSQRGEYNRVINSLAVTKGFKVVDAAGAGIPTSDRIHPTPEGQEKFADAIVGKVTSNASAAAQAQIEECLRQAATSRAQSLDSLDGPIKVDSSPGRLVQVPGFLGTTVDNRILPNLLAMIEKYKISVKDCYDNGSGHVAQSDHRNGVACDIYPGKDGSWDLVDELAEWAKPDQGKPRQPFRWVGYNGDDNHGRGNHLHISWQSAAAPNGAIPDWVRIIAPVSRSVGYADPGEGSQGSDGLVPRAHKLRDWIFANWGCDKLDRKPCVEQIGGYDVREKGPQDHTQGLALDITVGPGIGNYPGRTDTAFGWGMVCYFQANAEALGIQYAIWQGEIWNISRGSEGDGGRCTGVTSGWRTYCQTVNGREVCGVDLKATQGHYDHIHITVQPGVR